jgi:hypothetical protein
MTAPPLSQAPDLTPAPRSAGRGRRVVLVLLLAPLAGLGLWTTFALNWAYSEGDRAGVLQKFSRKGWLCKTYEGELAQYVVAGVAPQIWPFSVRDPAVADQIARSVGAKVQLHYSEHVGLPTTCFGETSYFVERITVQGDASGP